MHPLDIPHTIHAIFMRAVRMVEHEGKTTLPKTVQIAAWERFDADCRSAIERKPEQWENEYRSQAPIWARRVITQVLGVYLKKGKKNETAKRES